MSTLADTDTDTKTRLKRPRKFKVVLLNDDYTPMEFVIQVLKDIFLKSTAEAEALTTEIHEKGKGITGVYTREIAEQKLTETLAAAARYEHPLQGRVEEAE